MRYITGLILVITITTLVSTPFSGANPPTSGNNPPPGGATPGQTAAARQPMTDILDIAPPNGLGFNMTTLYWIGGIAAVLIIVLLIFFLLDKFLLKRRRNGGETAPVSTPPDIEAHNSLTMLAGRQTLEDRLFYFELTAILKRYLERQFAVDAMEKTTEELIPVIRKLSFDRELIEGIKDLMTGSDPVKYAQFSVDQKQRRADLAFVKTLVDKTKPQPQTQAGNNTENE